MCVRYAFTNAQTYVVECPCRPYRVCRAPWPVVNIGIQVAGVRWPVARLLSIFVDIVQNDMLSTIWMVDSSQFNPYITCASCMIALILVFACQPASIRVVGGLVAISLWKSMNTISSLRGFDLTGGYLGRLKTPHTSELVVHVYKIAMCKLCARCELHTNSTIQLINKIRPQISLSVFTHATCHLIRCTADRSLVHLVMHNGWFVLNGDDTIISYFVLTNCRFGTIAIRSNAWYFEIMDLLYNILSVES